MTQLSHSDNRKVSLLPSHVYSTGLGSCSSWLIKKKYAKATGLPGQSDTGFQSVELTGLLVLFNRLVMLRGFERRLLSGARHGHHQVLPPAQSHSPASVEIPIICILQPLFPDILALPRSFKCSSTQSVWHVQVIAKLHFLISTCSAGCAERELGSS